MDIDGIVGMADTTKMKVLVLAPHPFFVNRGTPIDVLLVLRALSSRDDVKVDCIVYPEGEEIDLANVTLCRLPLFKGIKGTRPGFSFAKILLDIVMLFYTWKMVHINRYDVIHAGEESVFIAMLMKLIYKVPYIYDLDSSIAQQMVEKHGFLHVIAPFFNWYEAKAIQGAIACAPVCNALADLCRKNGAGKIVTLHDISQLKNPDLPRTGKLNEEIGSDGLILLYCGNLEEYQGVGLLIDSFAYVVEKNDDIQLVIIGGIPEDIKRYKEKTARLRISSRVHFLGPRPFDQLEEYLAEADILTAPRIRGVNTPMKIFPYMHSGKPVLLTKLPTHTQIVTDNEAYLAPAEPELFGNGILELAGDAELRERLGQSGRAFVEKNHVESAHKNRVDQLYDWVKEQIAQGR
ncbi:MAG: glycosyltransferase family 4 protein [Deltaproteobacteria bacterium]|nr:glycosyltransferase family 4 protein [Deltaproteobacteria bacterium]